jgi:hypothetical protein
MRAFAELLDRLYFSHGNLAKRAILHDYSASRLIRTVDGCANHEAVDCVDLSPTVFTGEASAHGSDDQTFRNERDMPYFGPNLRRASKKLRLYTHGALVIAARLALLAAGSGNRAISILSRRCAANVNTRKYL